MVFVGYLFSAWFVFSPGLLQPQFSLLSVFAGQERSGLLSAALLHCFRPSRACANPAPAPFASGFRSA